MSVVLLCVARHGLFSAARMAKLLLLEQTLKGAEVVRADEGEVGDFM